MTSNKFQNVNLFWHRLKKRSYRGRKKLRYALYEAAVSLVGKNAEFRAIYEYYRTRKENSLKEMQSVMAVACKVIRVFYTILTKGVDYDAARLLGDIRNELGKRPSEGAGTGKISTGQ